jgi:hypothetical protein
MSEREIRTDDIASAPSEEESSRAEGARRAEAGSRHGEPAPGEAAVSDEASEAASARGPLLEQGEEDDFLRRWEDIQAGFVDQPRQAVQEADALVAGLMKRLAETFSEARTQLEGQWDRGDQVSTEDLRITLQRYRSFFTRLLSA